MVKARNLDDILRRIMPIINVQLIRDWETGVDDNYQFSLKFRWRMKNLFKYEERTNSPEEYYAAKREFEILGRVAACIIAFLGITMLPSMHTYATAFALSVIPFCASCKVPAVISKLTIAFASNECAICE